MENLRFRILTLDDRDVFDIRKIACCWDKKHYCFTSIEDDMYLSLLFYIPVAMFKNEELIGYGEVTYLPKINKKYSNDETSISYIINPNYRNKGYGKKLAQYLLCVAKRTYSSNRTIIEVLKKNSEGINFVESLDLDFIYFDNKKIVFEKKM